MYIVSMKIRILQGGTQLLLLTPKRSMPAEGVCLCLWYLGFQEEAAERMCQLPHDVLQDIIR